MDRKNFWLLIFFLCFLFSGFLGNYIGKIVQQPQNQAKKIQSYETQKVNQEAQIIYGSLYLKCNHFIKEIPEQQIRGLSVQTILKRYPPSDGWFVDALNPKHIMIYKKINGLCPEDSKKRHLGVLGKFVAVYRGPSAIKDDLERVTDILVDQLPKDFKQRLLNGQLNFANEDEMMEALDTIDEYGQ